jgi:hypothetical protein
MRVSPWQLIVWLVLVAWIEWSVGFAPISWSSWSRKQLAVYGVAFLAVIAWSFLNRDHR